MTGQESDSFAKELLEYDESDTLPKSKKIQIKKKKPKRAKLTPDRHLLMLRVPREIIKEGKLKAGDYFEFEVDLATKRKPKITITYVRQDEIKEN